MDNGQKPAIEIGDIKDSDQKYILQCVCAEKDCDEVLAETHPMTGKDMGDRWSSLVISAGFSTMKCPAGHPATYSDLNIHTEFVIKETMLKEADHAE